MSAKKTLPILLVLAVAVAGPACGDDDDSAAPATVACEDVAFTVNSDDLAAEIRATGVACAKARDFIRSSDGAPGASYRGYTCTSQRRDGATLMHTIWRCSNDGNAVAWKRFRARRSRRLVAGIRRQPPGHPRTDASRTR